jgi:hypothetical protein
VISFAWGDGATSCENHPAGSGRVGVVYDWVQSTICANTVDKSSFSTWCCPGDLTLFPFEKSIDIANVLEKVDPFKITLSCPYNPRPGDRVVFMDRFMGQDKCMRIDTSSSTLDKYYVLRYDGNCDSVHCDLINNNLFSSVNIDSSSTFFAKKGEIYRFVLISSADVGTYSFKLQVIWRHVCYIKTVSICRALLFSLFTARFLATGGVSHG